MHDINKRKKKCTFDCTIITLKEKLELPTRLVQITLNFGAFLWIFAICSLAE